MAQLSLHVTGAKLASGFSAMGLRPRASWRLTLAVQIRRDESLKLQTGEKENELEIHFSFKRQTQDELDFLKTRGEGFDKAIGGVHYFAASTHDFGSHPAALMFEIMVDDPEMETLLQLAANRLYPSALNVTVEGMDYDWQPDGSGKKWDNIARPILPITAADFTLPISEPPTESDEEDSFDPSPAPRPPESALPFLKEISQRILLMMYLLAAIAAAVIWKKW
jgi:hypothetical protein